MLKLLSSRSFCSRSFINGCGRGFSRWCFLDSRCFCYDRFWFWHPIFLSDCFGTGFIHLTFSLQTSLTILCFFLLFGVGNSGLTAFFAFFPIVVFGVGLLLGDRSFVHTYL